MTGANDLKLRAAIQQAPPDLAELIPGFELVKAIGLEAQLKVTLGRE